MYEVFETSLEARKLMEQNVSAGQLRDLRARMGETTLFQEGMMAAADGQTSLEEVLPGGVGPFGGSVIADFLLKTSW